MKTQPGLPRTAVVLLGLLAVIIVLHISGRAVPAELTLDDPAAMVATLARWVALVSSYYLFGIVLATAFLGERIREERWGRIAPASAIGIASILLGTSAVVTPIMIEVGVDDNSHGRDEPVPDIGLVLEELDTPLTLNEAAPFLPAPMPEPTTDQPRLVDVAAVDWWIVESGDSFWSIAEEHLEDELGDVALTEAAIAEYWQTLIDANIHRMADPKNPDLILPGQEFVLPRVQR